MTRGGTLVLYDAENLKTPLSKKKGKYILSRVDMLETKEQIRKTFKDTLHVEIAFVRAYHQTDHRFKKNERFFSLLENNGFEVVRKKIKKAKNIVYVDGRKFVYAYEECDMDAKIIHTILTIGRDFERIILLSGDDDMYDSLKYLKDEYGTDIVVIAHKENLSGKMKEFNHIFLHDLLNNKNFGEQDE